MVATTSTTSTQYLIYMAPQSPATELQLAWGSFDSDENWWQANFHRQIRNFVIDTRQTTRPKAMAALHYQVAQATSLQNLKFMLSTDAATEQVAICMFSRARVLGL